MRIKDSRNKAAPPTFDDIASKYNCWEQTPLGVLATTYERKCIFSLLPPISTSSRILDAGCGTGSFALILARQGLKVTGIDLSENMLYVAREKASAEGLAVEFIQGDLLSLPFASKSFDLITCLLVLEFTNNPQKVVKEIHRVLKPGGYLILSFLNRRSSWTVVRKIKGLLKPSIYNRARFLTRQEVAGLLSNAGFKEEAWKGAVYFFPLEKSFLLRFYPAWEMIGQKLFPHYAAYLAVRATKI